MSQTFLKEKALPNILVYFLKVVLPKEQENSFINSLRKAINNIYGHDRYVVYRVNEDDLRTNSRILSAKALLIIAKEEYSKDSIGFQSKHSELQKLTLNFDELCANTINNDAWNGEFNFCYFHEKIKTLIPQDPIKVESLLLDKNNDLYLFDSINLHCKWPFLGTSLKLVDHSEKKNLPNHSMPDQKFAFLIDFLDEKTPNQSGAKLDDVNFDIESYFDHLRTQHIGRAVLFQNITTTTMSLAKNVRSIHGIVVTTNYQTSGLGRNDNQWLSPFGCAMFTINLRFSFNDPLMKRISLIQHIASLSVILALPSKELGIKIKWPNDILFVQSMSKLAGILTLSHSFDNHFHVQIGIGINVSNHHPSVCLDELIYNYNANRKNSQTESLKLIGREEVIAKTLTNFENLYQKLIDNELEDIKQLYCDNWIHTDATVKIHASDDNENNKNNGDQPKSSPEEAQIIGIDDNGYLLAKDLQTDQIFCLQPDGNRFDMMNRLVARK